MRTISILIIISLFLGGASAQTKRELRKAKAEKEFVDTKGLVESGKFQFTADYVNSNLFGNRHLLSPPNTLELKKDSAFCDLPFFGRAYYSNPMDQGGIRFEEAVEDFELTLNQRKQQIILKFKCKGPADFYQCTFIISGGGSTTLSINSQNRSSISFWGKVSELNECVEKQ